MKLFETLGLKERELKEILNILASFENVERAIVYGSRAKGNYKPFSDIDLTLCGDGLTQTDILRIADRFEDSNLPYLFDISDFSKLTNPDLIDHIERRGITIFQNT
ncbi:MAG: nucleotidyltransferase domain-containing protein [Muribaculaceae bacterium]|nr:nucleotidyltransferase domain-containing protein [Muribaculaceae bacterium]